MKTSPAAVIFIVLFFSGPVFGAESAKQGDVEIVVDGEKYLSLHQYRVQRLKAQIQARIDRYHGSSLSDYLDSLEKKYLAQRFGRSKQEEIRSIFAVFRAKHKKPEIVETTSDMIQEMNAIIKARKKEGRRDFSSQIDPSKVKTWIINPGD